MKCIFPIHPKRYSAPFIPVTQAKQRGSMLFISVFVIVVLGMLGITLTSLLATSAESVTYEVLGLRALNAARSGLEVQVALAFPLDTSAATPAICGTSTQALSGQGFDGCQFNAQCAREQNVGSNGITYYRFSSTGTCTISGITVNRTVAVDARTF